ncbi:LysM domain-containing protein [Colletotrichum graminicola]|uniref:LysM domain-containing protein n=1 Tax=Colletotrichum graminicola (strain M1.001 / M2 / FGSC 10212) TaxID=645133 RepID=E3QAB5_COLGM|nr:LysM domain-containing protein [Colletotrichum graminicola M1.001]EFQ27803.1 LysM domain-containing protein [Colletotrichum graminicola M1.001]WDK11491.1 LysM domain-containing protein [Colletotrichum graminicola]
MQVSIIAVLATAASLAAALPTNTASPTCGLPGNLHKTKVKAGQTLTAIAERFHSGICDIVSLNKLENPNVIFPGQELLVPVDVCNPDNTSCITPVGEATCVKDGPATYVIASGDTFFTIAQKLGITTDSLTGANPGVAPQSLKAGQVINVPVCK